MYRNGALESELVTGGNAFLRRPKMQVSAADRQLFLDATERALSFSAKKLAGDARDVHALYASAVAHALRANFFYLVEKSWTRALRECIAARKADDEILRIDPEFIDAHLLHGLSEYVVSCLPLYMRILGSLNGFHGDKEDGIRELQRVARSNAGNSYDAAIVLAAIYRRERSPKDALPLVKMLAETFPRNYLFPLEQVQMYSDLGDKASALQVLSQIEQALGARQPGYVHLPLERVRYARGNLLFWYGDLDQSLSDLRQATRGADTLDLGTGLMAWLRLGQVYDLLGDHTRAESAYRTAMAMAPQSEIAREAQSYIKKPYQRKSK